MDSTCIYNYPAVHHCLCVQTKAAATNQIRGIFSAVKKGYINNCWYCKSNLEGREVVGFKWDTQIQLKYSNSSSLNNVSFLYLKKNTLFLLFMFGRFILLRFTRFVVKPHLYILRSEQTPGNEFHPLTKMLQSNEAIQGQ